MYGCNGQTVLLSARFQGHRAGYARLAIDGAHARLIDVHVYRRKGRWSGWPTFYHRGVDYRGKGIGTRLLETAIELCDEQGLSTLLGEMHGDIGRLTTWYQRHGFQVGPEVVIQREIQE